MIQKVLKNKVELGKIAAKQARKYINQAIKNKGEATIILATGASQFELLSYLTSFKDIDWSRVTCFHLDEYIGMSDTHPASFCKYLKERFLDQITRPQDFYFIHGDTPDPKAECARINEIINNHTIDLALIGIGENGHLAFNDPPADFEVTDPFIIVDLDDACRKQQFGEGWFTSLEAVPRQAISMSIRQIMKSSTLIVSVPDLRKAMAVECAVKGMITPDCPASILQEHPDCYLYLDQDSASRL